MTPWIPALVLISIPAVASNPAAQIRPVDGSRFGRAVCVLPDLDGDGVRELAVSASLGPDEVCWAGTVYVFSGREMEVVWSFDGPWQRAAIGARMEWVRRGEEGGALLLESDLFHGGTYLMTLAGELLRWFEGEPGEVLVAGDWDGDGYDDLAVAVDGSGAILSGRDLETRWEYAPLLDAPAVASAGDLDGDGRAELLVHVGDWPNAARLVFSSGEREAFELRFPPRDGRTGGYGRWVVQHAGDLDGDGSVDLVAGWSGWGDGIGRAAAFSGDDGCMLGDIDIVDLLDDRTILDTDFGESVAGGEDLDGDGRPDFVVGAPLNALTRARVYAWSLGRPAPLWSVEEWYRPPLPGFSYIGISISLVEDRDGDGVRDLLVGSADYWWKGGVHRCGNLRILSGATGAELWFLGVDELPAR